MFDKDAFQLRSARVVRFPALTRPADAVFVFRALRVGRHKIDLLADSSGNAPSASVAITVTPRPASTAVTVAVSGIVLLLSH